MSKEALIKALAEVRTALDTYSIEVSEQIAADETRITSQMNDVNNDYAVFFDKQIQFATRVQAATDRIIEVNAHVNEAFKEADAINDIVQELYVTTAEPGSQSETDLGDGDEK